MIKNFHRHIKPAGMAMLLALFSCSGESLPGLPGKADAERVPLRVAGASAGAGIGVQQTTCRRANGIDRR